MKISHTEIEFQYGIDQLVLLLVQIKRLGGNACLTIDLCVPLWTCQRKCIEWPRGREVNCIRIPQCEGDAGGGFKALCTGPHTKRSLNIFAFAT